MRRGVATIVSFCALLAAGCGKAADKPAAKSGVGAASSVALPGAVTASAADQEANKVRVVKAAAAVRCQLTGFAPPDDKVYAQHGFADAAAFGQAWDQAAKADPKWAETALANLYSQLCPGQRNALPAKPTTPTASEVVP